MEGDGLQAIDGWRCPHCKITFALVEVEPHVESGHVPVCTSCRLETVVVKAIMAAQAGGLPHDLSALN